MNLSVFLLLIAVKCLYLATANPSIVKEESKIIGGHIAEPLSHPYMVSLQTRFFYMRMHICGGSLLNEHFVLSAAHCATESWLIRWLPMDAVAGSRYINRYDAPTQVIPIGERITHPLYNGGLGAHDIAMFKTILPFKFTEAVQPIKLTTDFKYKSNFEMLKLAGWGALRTTTFIPDMPTMLQEVDVTYVPYDDCYRYIDNLKDTNEANPLDKNSNICTGPITGGVAACVGDSGGPLVRVRTENVIVPNDEVEQSTEEYNATLYDCPNPEQNQKGEPRKVKPKTKSEPFLVGVVSWGVSPCGERGAPTVYTNVITYLNFINFNLKHS